MINIKSKKYLCLKNKSIPNYFNYIQMIKVIYDRFSNDLCLCV